MVRIDMSEFMEKHSVRRAPDRRPSRATSATRRAASSPRRSAAVPTRWSCFDEIEKAHPDVFNVLLQVLDDGRLTDGQGRTVDFTNAVLIMTSNLQGDPADYFKPEFINRVDDIIRFRSLTEDDLRHIVEIQLERLRERLADRRITLEVTDEAMGLLAREGFDPAFGARPLKRVIQRTIGDRAAVLLLEGHVAEGGTIRVDAGAADADGDHVGADSLVVSANGG